MQHEKIADFEIWTISVICGARSAFFLPKTNNFKKFGVSVDVTFDDT